MQSGQPLTLAGEELDGLQDDDLYDLSKMCIYY